MLPKSWFSKPIFSHSAGSTKIGPALLQTVLIVFLAFFALRFSLLFYAFFPSFPKEFKGSAERKILAFFGGSLLFSLKKKNLAKQQGLEG